MTPNRPHGWLAQTPRADFAERTVAAILRDRAERQRGARPRWARPRWVGVASIAAILFAGGAWAWTAARHAPKTEDPSGEAPKITRVVQEDQPERSSIGSEPAPAPRAPPSAPSTAPLRRRETPSPDAGRKANLPRCNCVETICDCVELP